MEEITMNSLNACERAQTKCETKWFVRSLENMIDFATSMLGHDVTVRSIKNLNEPGKNVIMGQVKGIKCGKVNESISYHQSLFPPLLYYFPAQRFGFMKHIF